MPSAAYYQAKKAQNPEGWRRYCRNQQLKRNYGITIEQYEDMLNDQDGLCKICRKPCQRGKTLFVEHCHATGTVRGLCCYRCNSGLAWLEANLEAAMSYLGLPPKP